MQQVPFTVSHARTKKMKDKQNEQTKRGTRSEANPDSTIEEERGQKNKEQGDQTHSGIKTNKRTEVKIKHIK
jgi:hypothetical protein